MDTLTHALSGAPDLDFVLGFVSPLVYLEQHRGPTHSVLLLPLWALPLSWLLAKILREPRGWRALYGVTALGFGAHILGDLITSFGTIIFAPLSDARFGWGTTFIIDLWFSGVIVAGLLASLAWRRSRVPAVAAGAVLVCYVGFQAVLKERALDFAREYAQSQGLQKVVVTAIPRAASPFNWTVYVSDELAHRYAHFNLRRQEPAPAAHDFIGRMDAAFQPLALARWETGFRYGQTAAEQEVARSAWESPALGFMRWFAETPAFDGQTEGSTCVWFHDLRFVNPGREWVPFQYGACREHAVAPWRAYERLEGAARRALD